MPIVNSGRNQTGNGPDRCPGQTPATRLRPLPVYSAARQRSAPKPRPESASPSSSQVRTPAFQAGNTGSNPVGDTIAPAGTMLAPAGFGRRASPPARSAGSYPVGNARCCRRDAGPSGIRSARLAYGSERWVVSRWERHRARRLSLSASGRYRTRTYFGGVGGLAVLSIRSTSCKRYSSSTAAAK